MFFAVESVAFCVEKMAGADIGRPLGVSHIVRKDDRWRGIGGFWNGT